MGSVFVAEKRDSCPDEDEGQEPIVRVDYGGVYFFLYPEIQHLHDVTGELIDPQQNAFFEGSALEHLSQFITSAQNLALNRESEWEQRVGKKQSGEVWYQNTARADVLELLRRLAEAMRAARERHMGVLFLGE
jgi:hypothetical protein